MPRVQVGTKPSGQSAREKRMKEAAAAAAAAAADSGPSRRGEDDETDFLPEPSPVPAPVQEVVPHQAEAPEPHVIVPDSTQVFLAADEEGALTYTEPPQDADALTQIAHARRGIVNANRALAKSLGQLEGSYVLSAGRYLYYAMEKGSDGRPRFKAAGFKSVEAFAEPLGLTRQDVYRLRRAVPVYQILGGLITEPLNERTIRELYKTLTNEKEELDATPERRANLRSQFEEMVRMGRISSGGAVAARRLLVLGDATEIIESEPGTITKPAALEQLKKARAAKKMVSPELLREVQAEDPAAAQLYVSELRKSYEEAVQIVGEAAEKLAARTRRQAAEL